MIALIDADLVAYRCAASCEPTKAKEFLEPLEVAEFRATDLMTRILHTLGTDDYEVYLGGEDNFRYSIYPAYKGHRVAKKPEWLHPIRELLITQWGGKIVNGMETDDMLGIQQTRYDDASIICSLDKDLDQIPGQHYNWVQERSYYVSPLQGLRCFYKQVITGDGADNIPAFDGMFRSSLPKFVEKKLAVIDDVIDEQEMFLHCMQTFLDTGRYYDLEECFNDVKRNAQLVYILQQEDVHWHPPIGLTDVSDLLSLECLGVVPDDGPQSMNA
jgi:DNA polymerase-1